MRSILLFASFGGLLALAGCGIGSNRTYQEPLAAVHIVGTPVAGQSLQVEVDYRQTYPVDVNVECDLKQNGSVVQTIGTGVVPGQPGAKPDDPPKTGQLVFPFTVSKAGDYQVSCFTPEDVENKMKSSLHIQAQ